MNDPAHVKASEHGVLRVFHLSYAVSMEIGHMGTLDGLAKALGVERLEERDVQVVALGEIREMGLSEFLKLGYGIDEAELAPQRAALDGLEGKVAVLRSGAFGGQDVQLAAENGTRLVATLHEGGPPPRQLVQAERTPASAKGSLGVPDSAKGRPSDAAMSGRVAIAALLVLFALVAIMVWVAG